MEINAVAHWYMAHMLHAANQARLSIAGHDHACRIVQRLHGRTAQAVDRDGWNGVRNFRQQRGVTGDVETLLQRLLHTAPVNIIKRGWLQRRISRQQATH